MTVAAAESDIPSRNIAKATRSVIWRISTFYILSIFVIISVVPWNDPQLAVLGSYPRALELMNIPYAAFLVELVVLIAVASCMNSSIYIASRMLYSLAKRGQAPAMLKQPSSVGVPRAAVFGSTLIGAGIAILNFFAPAGVFEFLLASSGAIALLVYLVIAISQLGMRARLERENVELGFRMWLFPWLTWAVIVFISCALGGDDVYRSAPRGSQRDAGAGDRDFVYRDCDFACACKSGDGRFAGVLKSYSAQGMPSVGACLASGLMASSRDQPARHR
ncbi:amino acid permease [Pseudomonas capeferrum]|uniref:amino acid permease n=1 Tax=Pseudomonas capeferrum TaxID=1495066 RepID=UPI00280B0894|nr:amino acid permease [Pseudomonas capeferrum]